MATEDAIPAATEAAKPAPAPVRPVEPEHVAESARPSWQKYGTPFLVVLLAAAVVYTISRNWNSWEGGRIEQVTDDAYVRGDLTPLSTKVAGIVKDVEVADFQSVHRIRRSAGFGFRKEIRLWSQVRLYGKKTLTIDHQNYVVNASRNQEAMHPTQEARARAVVWRELVRFATRLSGNRYTETQINSICHLPSSRHPLLGLVLTSNVAVVFEGRKLT